jgi:hypothetical protein
MMKAFSFFAFMFVGTSLMIALMSGGGGLASTSLNMATMKASYTAAETNSTLTNGTGTFTGSPITLALGTTTVAMTGQGTCVIALPVYTSGFAISGVGVATVTQGTLTSPVALVPGNNTINVANPAGNFTVTLYQTITVDSNVAFANNDILWIDDEQIQYVSKSGTTQFNVLSAGRGYKTTEPATHANDAVVRTEDNGVMNSIFGFDIGQVFDAWGLFAFPIVVVRFFTQTIPYMIQGNMGSLFQGNGLAIIVNLWLVFGVGFVFMLIMALINARRQ